MPRTTQRGKRVVITWSNRPCPTTKNEAIDSIVDGMKYFLKKKPYTTLLVLGGTLLGFLWGGSVYLGDKRDVKFEDRKPMSEDVRSGGDGLFSTPLYAGDREYRGDTLWIHGKPWAFIDTNYQLWKEYGKPTLIVHDKRWPVDQMPGFVYIEDFDDKTIQKNMMKSK